jgi:hypothetical protein
LTYVVKIYAGKDNDNLDLRSIMDRLKLVKKNANYFTLKMKEKFETFKSQSGSDNRF